MKNKKDGINIAQNKLKSWQKALEIMPQIRQVIKSFDGKVLNKRFTDKINEIDPLIYSRVGYNSNYASKKSLEINVRLFQYTYGDYVSVLWCYDIESQITDNNRLNAEKALKMLDEKETEIKKNIAETQIGLSQIDLFYEKFEQLQGYADYLNKMIPNTIKNFFDFRVTIKTY